ncbi:hypothetical protein LINGRAHAP2_LOCUS38538 [Linum grandiflorum]
MTRKIDYYELSLEFRNVKSKSAIK